MKENYLRRMMAARDPRFAKIASKLGYGTRDMVAERAEPIEPPKPAVSPEPVEPEEDIAAVRAQYQRVVGKKPYNGWDILTLRRKMAEAKDKG